MSDTGNTNQAAPATFADMLAASGYTAKARKVRLTIGADVANAFTDAKITDVMIVGAEASDAYTRKVAELADKFPNVLVLGATNAKVASIAAHVSRLAETRSLAWTKDGITISEGVPVGGVDSVGMAVHVTRK